MEATSEILIRRPRREVASYMFDPSHDAEWTTGVLAVQPLTPGWLRPGSRVERTVRFLGRRFDYTYEVTETVGDALVAMEVDHPFPMRIRYELEEAGDRTRARIRAAGEPGGFFRLAGPLLEPMVRRSIGRDLEQLRDRMEARA